MLLCGNRLHISREEALIVRLWNIYVQKWHWFTANRFLPSSYLCINRRIYSVLCEIHPQTLVPVSWNKSTSRNGITSTEADRSSSRTGWRGKGRVGRGLDGGGGEEGGVVGWVLCDIDRWRTRMVLPDPPTCPICPGVILTEVPADCWYLWAAQCPRGTGHPDMALSLQ